MYIYSIFGSRMLYYLYFQVRRVIFFLVEDKLMQNAGEHSYFVLRHLCISETLRKIKIV